MKIAMYQVDAFTNKLFGGNPAAVCMPEQPLTEDLMQRIAAENNQAETAFVAADGDGFHIRWFTPAVEVVLCGHATLAAAHIIFTVLHYQEREIVFHSRFSGELKVTRDGDKLTLDFPLDAGKKIPTPAVLVKALGVQPMETWKGKTDFMAVLPSEKNVLDLRPDMELLRSLDCRGVIVTAAGEGEVDFVSRFFAPQSGINEDPVTGSAHTLLAPYWAAELRRNPLTAVQLSSRRGHLWCTVRGDRVAISGYAVTYLKGTIEVS